MAHKLRVSATLLLLVVVSAVMSSPAQATFTSAGYPATVTGTSTESVIDVFGSTIKCSETKFSGTMSEASSTLTLTSLFNKCIGFGLWATASVTQCDLLLHKNTGVSGIGDIACALGNGNIHFYITSSSAHTTQLCQVDIPAQTGKSGFTFTNEGGKLKMSGTIGGLTAKISHRTSIVCPVGPEESGAKYTIQASGIVLSGNNGAISVD